mgnify:CR=1 FL=1
MEALEEKKITVMEMTAAVAASSIAVAAIPGDATTPLADQIAELGSYLMIAAGAVMLEKFLLAITGHAAFSLLIPAGLRPGDPGNVFILRCFKTFSPAPCCDRPRPYLW